MYRLLWKQIEKLNLKRRDRQRLFLAACTLICALTGALVWFSVGDNILGQSLKWMVFFIGIPSVILGFVCGVLALFKLDQ